VEALGLLSKSLSVCHQKKLGKAAPTGSIQEAAPLADMAHGRTQSAAKYGLDIAAVSMPDSSDSGNIL